MKETKSYKIFVKKALEEKKIYLKYQFITIRSNFEILITEYKKDK